MNQLTEFQIHENENLIEIAAGAAKLEGILGLPENPAGIIMFAHGSGGGRLSPRNNIVARALRDAGFGTLLMDLLMVEEADNRNKLLDMNLLAQRLLLATDWLAENSHTKHLPIGYFGADTGAGVALVAAAQAACGIPVTGEPGPRAVVSRGGRVDLAGSHLADVKAPTLLIVGGGDEPLIGLNREAHNRLKCEKEFAIIPGASHLFEEPGALEEVARLANDWFKRHMEPARDS